MPFSTKDKERFEKRVAKGLPDECWIWTGNKNQFGYGRFVTQGTGTRQVASRIAYQMYVGRIGKGLFVCHRCDNPSCVNPNHLFLGTSDENIKDSAKKGRMNRGENNARSKLTADDVIEIRIRHSLGDSPTALASEFGVKKFAIHKIVSGTRWKHV